MQAIKAAIRQKWVWACQNKPFWAHALFLIATLAFLLIPPARVNGTLTDLPVRLWGMCLQIIGAFIVWKDLTKTAKDFGTQTPNTLEWLKQLFRTPPPIEGTVITLEQPDTMIFTGYAPTVTQSGQPIEVRLTRLESEVAAVSVELGAVRGDITTHKRELSIDIENRTARLHREISSLRGQVEVAFIGNYTKLNFGAIWLLVGIFLSSIAVEITNLVHLHKMPRMW